MAEKRGPGRPKKKALSEQMYTRETAWDATNFIGILPDPDRTLELLGLSAEDAFKDIETDDHLTSVRAKRLGKLHGLEWDILKDQSSAQAFKAVTKMFDNLDIRQFCTDVTRALGWGNSPIEPVWGFKDRYITPLELLQKPPRWFEYNPDNEVRFLSENYYGTADGFGDPVPPYKLLLPTHEPDYDNPYGIKLLSRSYWLINFKRNAMKWWNQGLEKILVPFMYAKVPPSTSTTEVEKIKTFLANMVQAGVGTIPNDCEIEALEQKNTANNSTMFNEFWYALDKGISKLWLGGTLTTDIGDVGSYSASQTHEGAEDALVRDDADMVEKTANTLIKWFMEINALAGPPPIFKMNEPFKASKELAERDKFLNEQGVDFNKDYYVENHGLDKDHFEIREPEEEKEPEPNEDFSFSKGFKEQLTRFKDQQAVDEILESITPEELQKQSEGMLKPIIEMINNAESYEEIADKLLKQWPKMDSSSLEETLLQATFVGEAIGQLGARREG